MSDWLGLKKVEEDMKRSLSFDIFKEDKAEPRQRKFFKPKPKYTSRERPNYTREIQQVKKVMKSTGSGFNSVVEKIKNRKIHKLEKEALKAKAKADQLAHEIKTKNALVDSLNDIKRYEKEKEKADKELKDAKAGKFNDENS